MHKQTWPSLDPAIRSSFFAHATMQMQENANLFFFLNLSSIYISLKWANFPFKFDAHQTPWMVQKLTLSMCCSKNPQLRFTRCNFLFVEKKVWIYLKSANCLLVQQSLVNFTLNVLTFFKRWARWGNFGIDPIPSKCRVSIAEADISAVICTDTYHARTALTPILTLVSMQPSLPILCVTALTRCSPWYQYGPPYLYSASLLQK